MKQDVIGDDGLPVVVGEGVSPRQTGWACLLQMALPRIVALGPACVTYACGQTAMYDDKIRILTMNSLSYLYLAAVNLSMLVSFMNIYPQVYKNRIMRPESGPLTANPVFFKVNFPIHERQALPFVVMEEDGAVGQYNRASRALQQFTEGTAGFILCVLLAGYVFPFPVYVLSTAFAVGRIASQVGYAEEGSGAESLGATVSTLAAATVEMLVLLAGVKALYAQGANTPLLLRRSLPLTHISTSAIFTSLRR